MWNVGTGILAVAKVQTNARSVFLEDFTIVFSIPLNLLSSFCRILGVD